MRYTRLEPVKRIANSKIRVFISFIVVIPVVAIIIGNIITRTLILPFAIKNEAVTNSNINVKTSTAFKKRDFSIFILQAGAFANLNNGNMLKNAITGIGEKANMIMDNNVYRVIVGIDENKESINKIKDKLSKNGYACLINEIETGVESNEKELVNYTDTVNSVIYEQINIEKDSSKVNIESLKKGVEEVEKSFTLIKGSKIYSKKGQEIDAFNKGLLELMNGYIKEYENKGKNSFKYITEEAILIKNFYKSIDGFETNNNI